MELNSSSTRLAVIDMNGILKFYDIKKTAQLKHQNGEGIKCLDFERKDVWNMKWADDNADLLAVMEKSRMYILRGTELEEPVSCTAYLCSFHALQIQAVQLDEIMQQPETPGKQHVFYYETKSLRDTQQILEATHLQDAFSYIEEHSHPRLWTTLAEHALQKLDLSIAEKAFVRCKNYFGIQFVKRVHSLKEPNEQKAEVVAFIQHGSTLASIECCLDLNMWKMAFELGEKYDQVALVNDRFNQYIQYLLKCENHTLAIKAAESAQQHLHVAKLLKGFAKKLTEKKVASQTVKQAYVLMASNIEKWKASAKSLKVVDNDMEFVVERPWHYAEAYHLWGLVHQHLYLNHFEDAFHASVWLNEYEDVLNIQSLYSLQAVTCFHAQRIGECSKVFKNLEETKNLPSDTRERLTYLSSCIFHDHNQMKSANSFKCLCKECKSSIQIKDKKCPSCDYQYHLCVASGHLIMDEDFLICEVCKHFIKSSRAINYYHCPLCHADLALAKASKPMYKPYKKKILR